MPQSFNLLIDFEATGVDPKEARIMEVGALITEEDWTPVANMNALVYQPETFPIPEEVKKVTNLDEDTLAKEGIPLRDMFERIFDFIQPYNVNYFVAYNREYDENLFNAEYERVYKKVAPKSQWVCAMKDIEKNYEFKCWKMSHLALDHGVAVDPNGLHRAINDVLLMRTMLEKLAVTAQTMFEFQNMPWSILQAKIPKPWEDGGKGKDLAVKLGYSWETPRGSQQKFEKCWVKKVKVSQVEMEIKRAAFKVVEIGESNG